jgi:virginiamycin B lyase
MYQARAVGRQPELGRERPMNQRHFWSFLSAGVAASALLAASANAQGLSGAVTSVEEPTMEGVLVTAKKDGSTIAVTVVTDAQGKYSFPPDRIGPGKYNISVRAIGYVIDGAKSTEVPEGKAGNFDIKLSKTKNVASQLSNGEWLMSMPGSDKDKQFLDACAGCHTYQRIVNSTYEAEDFRGIFRRMGSYSPGSMPTKPQPLLPGPRGERPAVNDRDAPRAADFLTKVNLSQGPSHSYQYKTYPRPKGRATKVIITEYDLPRKDWEPHDVILDHEGMVWFSDFGDQFMGRMDPKTGKVEAFPLPMMKTDGSPKGGLEISEAPNGDIWESGMYQGGIYRWDRATGKVQAYKIPDKWQTPSTQESMVSPQHSDVDGFVWTNDQQNHSLLRLDPKKGAYEQMGETKDAAGKPIPGYGMPTDLKNRPFLLEFSGTRVGWYNPETKVAEVFSTPFQGSAPRRGRVDAKGRLFFAEYRGNGVGMFDPATKTIKEWKLPTPWSAPYDVVATSKGEVWAGSMLNDYVNRLDTTTGEVVDYLLPRTTNIRRVFVDEKGPRPVLWVGSNHGASVVKVEPLD